MDRLVQYVTSQVDATNDDLKTSLKAIDSAVDSKLSHLKLELVSFIQSGVIDCIRAQTRNQHWRVETIYVPLSPNQQLSPNSALPEAKHSTRFVHGVPPPLDSSTANDEVFADIAFPSGHFVTIPLTVPENVEINASTSQSTSSGVSIDSSFLPEMGNTQHINLSLFPQIKETFEESHGIPIDLINSFPSGTVKNVAQKEFISSRSARSKVSPLVNDLLVNSRQTISSLFPPQSFDSSNVQTEQHITTQDSTNASTSEKSSNTTIDLSTSCLAHSSINHHSARMLNDYNPVKCSSAGRVYEHSILGEMENCRRLLIQSINASNALQKKYDLLQVEYSEFKMNANKSLEDKERVLALMGQSNRVRIDQLENRQRELTKKIETNLRLLLEARKAKHDSEIESVAKFNVLQFEYSEFKLSANKLLEDKKQLIKSLQPALGISELNIKSEPEDSVVVNESLNHLHSIPSNIGQPSSLSTATIRQNTCDNVANSDINNERDENNLLGSRLMFGTKRKESKIRFDCVREKKSKFGLASERCTLDGCRQLFSDESQLSTHKSLQHEAIARPFKCTFKDPSNSRCGNSYANRKALFTHIQSEHPK